MLVTYSLVVVSKKKGLLGVLFCNGVSNKMDELQTLNC